MCEATQNFGVTHEPFRLMAGTTTTGTEQDDRVLAPAGVEEGLGSFCQGQLDAQYLGPRSTQRRGHWS